MRKTREILRLKWELRRSHREIKRATEVGLATVSETIARAIAAHLDWAAVTALGDEELERRLYPEPHAGAERPLPDPATLDLELRKAGVTLRRLHHEYVERNPIGAYGYTQFCEHYRAWKLTQRVIMREVHRAGDRLFVGYSERKPCTVDRNTGEPIEVELFVAVLGASSYTYAEATRTQTVADRVMSLVRALEYFGGAPAAIVPDPLVSDVARPHRYEPGVQRTYDDFGRHYNTVIFPAQPRDKALVEPSVQLAQRWMFARLRHQTCASLEELDERIAELREDLNTRVMARYKASRRDLFEQLERSVLKPLPADRFSYVSGGRRP